MNETNGHYIGKVKWYNEHRGYGWIATDGQGDFYFHATGLLRIDEPLLKAGELVSFTTLPGPKGIRAINVQRITLADLKGANNHEDERNETERK
jgi:CspA family cold shock protein